MSPWRGFASLLVLATAGCATVRAVEVQEPIAPGLAALQKGEYALASEALTEIWEQCPGGEMGERALLLVVAAALDPRNPEWGPTRAAELAASYLRVRSDSSWRVPITEVLYLLALELGAPPVSHGEGGGESSGGNGGESWRENGKSPSHGYGPENTPSVDGIAARLAPLTCPAVDLGAPPERPLPALARRSIAERTAALEQERSALQRRVRTLEQLVESQKEELERIRRILNHGR